MDFDFKKWNENIDRIQSFKPGTREWNKRIEEEMYQMKLRTPSPEYIRKIMREREEKQKNKNESDGCFITTACMKSRGLDDNCEELEILRKFRDDYIKKSPNGNTVISEYYILAPHIAKTINNHKFSKEIYNSIYNKMILPIIELIKNKEYERAYQIGQILYFNLKSTFMM